MTRRIVALLGVLVFTGCATPRTFDRLAGEEPRWAAPPIHRAVTVLDGRTGESVTFEAMLDALAEADAVFLGETHVDETTHRVELAVYEGLLARRNGMVVLAMEMFARDVQSTLDAYLDGRIDEAEFLAEARPWRNYRSAYRPLIERARADGRPVVASNIPRSLTRRIAMEGASALETLEGDERLHTPAEVFANTPAYWKRVDNAVRGHLAMMRGGGGDDDQRLLSTQTLWDNTMGESCSLALDAHRGYSVLHVNGGFHSAYWDGTVRQFQLRKPKARVLTVDITATPNPAVAELGGIPVADYIVMAEARATDVNDGTWEVALQRSLGYRLHMPKAATDTNPVPLLIWLGADGVTARDGLDLWRDRLGDRVAIAVLEPPYRGLLDDLSEGGRWFWADSFSSDVGSLVSATERVWAYLLRNYPVDSNFVCVAGEGTGATVTAAIALLGDRMDFDAVAFNPRRYAKIRDYPLPLAEYRGDDPAPDVSLQIIGRAEDEAWWQEELASYAGVGLDGNWRLGSQDPWQWDRRQENAIRGGLGLQERSATDEGSRAYLVIGAESPRARHWSRLYALRHTAATGQPVAVVDAVPNDPTAVELTISVHPSTLNGALPKCPGPFGGTTVIVLPDDLPAADVKAWIALEENDPLNKASRFHRLRVATLAGERSLTSVLVTLEDAGRKNVLIVPAVFCADGTFMRGLERTTRSMADRMTLHWLPGLGGEDLPVAMEAAQAKIGTVGHELHVVLNPETHHVSVNDTIALPPTLRRAGVEFTLNDTVVIREGEELTMTVTVVAR